MTLDKRNCAPLVSRYYLLNILTCLLLVIICTARASAQGICDPNYVGGSITITPDNSHNIREFIDLVNQRFSAGLFVGTSVGEVPLNLTVTAPWTSILRVVMADNGLTVECYDNGTYNLISTLAVSNTTAEALNRKRELHNQQALLDIQGAEIQRKNSPIVREVIRLNTLNLASNTTADLAGRRPEQEDTIQSLENAVRSIIHADGDTRGEIKRIPEQNAFLIAATQSQLNDIHRLIYTVDRPRLQVFLKALIYTVDEKRLRENGSKFAPIMGNVNQQSFLQPTGLANANNPDTVLGVMTTDTVTFLGLLLEAQQHGVVKVLGRPFGVVLDGDTFDSEAGDQITVAQAESENRLQFVEASRTLRVRPQVSEGDEGRPAYITLNVQLENNAVHTASGKYKGLPDVNRQSIQTVAHARDGQVVVIGGLTDPVSVVTKQTPGLANTPVIGRAFKRKKRETLYCAIVAQVIPRWGQ